MGMRWLIPCTCVARMVRGVSAAERVPRHERQAKTFLTPEVVPQEQLFFSDR